MLKPQDILRFRSKVRQLGPQDCWQWLDKPDKRGYGHFILNKKNLLAHHVAFLINKKREPNGYLQHSCNNSSCVNPNHIYEGKNQGRPSKKCG